MAGTVAYTASKHAVNGITKTAAMEGRSVNVRVNAVSPGFLETPMIQGLLGSNQKTPSKVAGEQVVGAGEEVKTNGDGNVQKTAQMPRSGWETFEARQGRKAAFEEVGDVVVSLCGTRMSLVNGQNLFIDGGFSVNEGSN
jgi:NAD(P)-dependent dehydrogenase (short-subunit alcohol dehydrogenase family)